MTSPTSRFVPEGSSQDLLVELLRHGPAPRAALARRLGLSSGSLTRLTKPLVEQGLLTQTAAAPAQSSGRPALPLRVNPDAAHFIGIKVVAGRAFTATIDLLGKVLSTSEFALDTATPIAAIATLSEQVRRECDRDALIAATGVALGARVHHRRMVVDSALLGWSQVDLAAELTALTGLPTHVENDVSALTQAESWFGTARAMDDFVLLTVGVGIGGGIVAGGQQLTGVDGTAGTISHLELDPEGPVCSSGHVGCGVTTITSAAVAARASAALGRELDFAQTLASTEPAVRAVTAHAATLIGKLAGMVATVLAPEQILISGDGVELASRHPTELHHGFAAALPQRGSATSLTVVEFDFTEWARGAAVVALQMHVTG